MTISPLRASSAKSRDSVRFGQCTNHRWCSAEAWAGLSWRVAAIASRWLAKVNSPRYELDSGRIYVPHLFTSRIWTGELVMPRRIRDANVIDAALDGKPEVLSAARYIRTLIGYAAALLALAFTWLSFKGIDFRPVAADITAKQILEVTMALYYALWVAGLKSDTDEQEMLYVAKPSKAHTYFGGAVTATIITALFALLCWVRTPGTFAYALLGFH